MKTKLDELSSEGIKEDQYFSTDKTGQSKSGYRAIWDEDSGTYQLSDIQFF